MDPICHQIRCMVRSQVLRDQGIAAAFAPLPMYTKGRAGVRVPVICVTVKPVSDRMKYEWQDWSLVSLRGQDPIMSPKLF